MRKILSTLIVATVGYYSSFPFLSPNQPVDNFQEGVLKNVISFKNSEQHTISDLEALVALPFQDEASDHVVILMNGGGLYIDIGYYEAQSIRSLILSLKAKHNKKVILYLGNSAFTNNYFLILSAADEVYSSNRTVLGYIGQEVYHVNMIDSKGRMKLYVTSDRAKLKLGGSSYMQQENIDAFIEDRQKELDKQEEAIYLALSQTSRIDTISLKQFAGDEIRQAVARETGLIEDTVNPLEFVKVLQAKRVLGFEGGQADIKLLAEATHLRNIESEFDSCGCVQNIQERMLLEFIVKLEKYYGEIPQDLISIKNLLEHKTTEGY